MALDRRLLDILCCPVSRQPLGPLSREQLAAVNAAVAAGRLTTTQGDAVERPLDGGLLTRDGKLVYRIDDGIPVMLADEAVATSQIADFPG